MDIFIRERFGNKLRNSPGVPDVSLSKKTRRTANPGAVLERDEPDVA